MADVDPENDVVDPEQAGEPGARSSRRPLLVVGALLVVILVGGAVAWWFDARDPSAVTGDEAVESFLEASERNLDATYRLEGEFVRTLPDGRRLVSGLLVVQRPPDRLQRALGSTVGTIGGQTVNCPAGESCAAAAPVEPFDVRRAEQVQALEEYVAGDDPVYAVTAVGDDCFELVRRRTEPAAVYGREAELCFDRATGALRRLEVEREGGATDLLDGLTVSGQVTDADFDLSSNDTYDPRGA